MNVPELSIVEVLANDERRGFVGQFSCRPDGVVRCHACKSDEPAVQAPVLAMHRLEGASDPSDQAIVAALECPACGALGTVVLSYGPEASAEDSAVLQQLLDDRDPPGIRAGA